MKPFQKMRSCAMTAISVALILFGCSKDYPTNIGVITLQNSSTLGSFLVDGNGKTLYYFANDFNVDDATGQSECTGGCLNDWPVYYAPDLKPGDGIDINDFTTVTRSDGKKQTAYKHRLLYYFSGDKAKGDTNGEASDNVWFVAKPDYSILLANAQLKGGDGNNYTSAYQLGTGETEFFVDAAGRTLYTFTHDFYNVNKFTTTDATHNAIWPVFNTTIASLPSVLNATDFGTITAADGNTQMTYKGNPLYYYSGDANPRDTKGVSAISPGTWRVVTAQTAMPSLPPTITVIKNGTSGTILADALGRTLYFFAKNTVTGVSNCSTGACPQTWPLFNVDQIILPANSGLNLSDFATITITGTSTKQVTYKGRPLHFFAPNHDGVIEAAGQKGGDNFGPGLWFVANPHYSVMVANAQLVGDDGSNYLIDNTNFPTPVSVKGNGPTSYLTDSTGHTFYIFKNDGVNVSNFTGTIFWKAELKAGTTIKLPSATGLSATDFGTVTGGTQLTYKGWPVYVYTPGPPNNPVIEDVGATRGVSIGFSSGSQTGPWPTMFTNTPHH